MFKRILVALDGSELAEAALAPAFALAEKFGGEVVLLRVTVAGRVFAGAPLVASRTYFPEAETLLTDERDAADYLQRINRRCRNSGVTIRTRALPGTPAEAVVAAARDEAADLIVMSTHGRSGLDRLVYGSVAEAVLRGAHVPVLLVPLRTLQS
jgi:nucleotide-binding universal stress UspA family protein